MLNSFSYTSNKNDAWKKKTYFDLADYINGFGFKPSQWGGKGLKIIRIQNLNGSEDFNYFGGEIDSKYIVTKGDLLFSWSATIDIFEWKGENAVLNQHIFKVLPKKIIDKKFLFYLIKNYLKQILSRTHGSTMKHFKKEELKRNSLYLPINIKTQKRIVEILDHFSNHIKLIKKQIKILERIKTKSMDLIFTKGLKGEETEYCEESKQEKPKIWKIKKIGGICNLKRGSSPRPISNKKFFSDVGRGWVRIRDTTNIYKFLEETEQKLSILGESKSTKGEIGEVIMSICATIGKSTILKIPVCVHDGFVIFKNLSVEINNEFLFYFLNHKRNEIKNLKQVGTQGNLNISLVERIYLLIPKIDEQKEIINFISSFDDLIEIKEKKLKSLEKIFNYFCEELLSGRVRVVEE